MNKFTTDIIIVGGGIIGCAIFHALAKFTHKKILLIEQGHIANKITGESGGLVRLDHSNDYLLQLTTDSLAYYRNFKQHTGAESSFVETGCFCNNLQNMPLFQPFAGYINPTLTCQQWLQAAENSRARILPHTQAYEILQENNQIRGIITQDGNLFADNVIIAAGTYSLTLLNTLPDFIFTASINNQAFQYSLYQYKNFKLPAIIDLIKNIYIIPQKNYFIAGFFDQDQLVTNDSKLQLQPHLTKQLNQALKDLLIDFTPEINIISTHISVDAFTPDHLGYTGAVLPYQGLYLATGYSAGGIKIAPAIAQQILKYFTH